MRGQGTGGARGQASPGLGDPVGPATRRPGRSCRAFRPPRTGRRPRAGSSNGTVAAIGTVTAPRASSGRTWRSTRRAAAALSSSGRGRSVEPWMRPRLAIRARRLTSALNPAPTPMTAMRPPVARARRFPFMFGAPTSSSTTSKGPWSTKASGATTVAPRAATPARDASVRTVATTSHAGRHRQLDRGRAHAAGGAVDAHPLAHAQLALREQGVVGGRVVLGEAAGLGPARCRRAPAWPRSRGPRPARPARPR